MSAPPARLSRLILRHPFATVLLGLALTLPSFHWTAQLYSHLKLDLEELLPRKAQAVLDLGEIRGRLLSMESLALIVTSEHPKESRRFVDDLASELSRLPSTVSAGVEYRIHDEIAFFERRKALFMDLADLRRLRRYVSERLDYETELHNPLNIFAEREIPEPRLPLSRLLARNQDQRQIANYTRFPNGYYATPDEKSRAVLVYLPAEANNVEGRQLLKDEVVNALSRVAPARYAPDLEVHFTGEVQNNIDEYESVLGDIARSATVVTVVVTAALLLYFKTVLGTAALLVTLLMARFWAFAVTWFRVGYLNANSAFMGAIVLGSGITYGVMLLSRYMEERRAGQEPRQAAETAMSHTARATWTAALAAGLAYGSLSLTEFEGFKQYGLIGFAAMLLCWISALCLLPALLLVVERIHPLVGPAGSRSRENRHRIVRPVARALARAPKASLAISTVLTAASLAMLASVDPERIMETDLSRLRSEKSMVSGSGHWALRQDQIFRSYLSPLVLMPASERDAERIAASLKKQKNEEGPSSLMASVRTIRDFVPSDQAAKIRELEAIRELLPREVRARLAPKEQKLVRDLLTPEAMRRFGTRDLPLLVRSKFTERDGSLGRLVLIEPPLSSQTWDLSRLDRFVTDIRSAAREATGAAVPLAGSQPVTRDMFEAINRDGPKATAAALVAVMLLVIALFRRPSQAGLVLLSLVVGVLWMCGFALAYGIKINFLNFIALPITFGIGVDYGVNILERYRYDPDGDIMKALRETGSAVTLCSFTTIAGYGSLIIASNQAFVSFGLLAAAGELGTMLAALLTLPAILVLLQRRKERRARVQAPPPSVEGRRAA